MKYNVENINNFFIDLKDEDKLDSYLQKFTPFSKKTQGKSGAIVGYIDNKTVMKISKVRYDKNSIIQKKDCIFLKSQINEILINTTLTNLENFVKLDKDELRLKNKYLLKVKDYGLGNNKSYIINNKVGVSIKDEYFTNLDNIFVNHIEILKNNLFLVDNYQDYLIKHILNPLLSVLKLFNKKIGFYHTDFKLANIFIKHSKMNGYKKLKDNGLYLDFIPLISDLDKSRIKINNNKILAINDSVIKTFVGSKIGYEPLLSLRYKCRIAYGKEKCIKFKSVDFDLLTMLINIYLILFINKVSEHFDKLDNFVKEKFNFNKKDIADFKLVIKKNVSSIDIIPLLSVTRMSKIILQLCNKLEY